MPVDDEDPIRPWFATARKPPFVLHFKINRRAIPQGNLFSTQPENFFDHLVESLLFGLSITTGTKKQRVWKLGNSDIDLENRMITGQVGFESLTPADVSRYNESTQSWEDVHGIADTTARALFLIDAESEHLLVPLHPLFSAAALAQVFDVALNRGEFSRFGGATTEWEIEPMLDSGEFREWINAADAVDEIHFTAKTPNPEGLSKFGPLWKKLEDREASAIEFRIKAKNPETGLRNVEDDDFIQGGIEMASSGYAAVTSTRLRNGRVENYNSTDRLKRPRLKLIAQSWPILRDLLKELALGERDD